MDIRIVIYISIFSVLIPLGLATVQWNKIPRDIAALRWLLVAGLISDVTGRILSSHSINNQWVGDIIMFIQFTILLYIFSLQFDRNNIFKIVYSVVVLFYILTKIAKNAGETLIEFSGVYSLVLIIVSIAFFYKLLNELKVANVHRLPILWIAFAALFYYSGNLFVFLASSYLEKDPNAYIMFWMWIHNALNITKNILFAVALWQSYRTMKSLT